MEKLVGKLSKKLSVVAGYIAWLTQAPLPDEVKVKYAGGLALGYVIVQGIIDGIKAWKGRNPSTGSNASESPSA